MNILITNWSLSTRTGTELVVYELAVELRKRGHRVAAYSSRLGDLAELIRGASIPVVHQPLECPFKPDIIHGQHHLDAMTALLAYPGVPVVYHAHGGRPWLEKPPRHPQICHYIAMCDVLADTMSVELGLSDSEYSVVPNWVDCHRFRNLPRENTGEKPKALLFGGGLANSKMLNQFASTFQECGFQLESASDWSVKDQQKPELALLRYDVVLASGRSALEALSVGCAVIIAHYISNAGWVTTDSYEKHVKSNFSPRQADSAYDGRLLSQQLKMHAELKQAGEFAKVTALVARDANLQRRVDQIEAVYQSVLHSLAPSHKVVVKPEDDRMAMHHYLRNLSPAVKDVESIKLAEVTSEDKLKKLTAKYDDLKKQHHELEKNMVKAREELARFEGVKRHWLGRLACSLAKKKKS